MDQRSASSEDEEAFCRRTFLTFFLQWSASLTTILVSLWFYKLISFFFGFCYEWTLLCSFDRNTTAPPPAPPLRLFHHWSLNCRSLTIDVKTSLITSSSLLEVWMALKVFLKIFFWSHMRRLNIFFPPSLYIYGILQSHHLVHDHHWTLSQATPLFFSPGDAE